MKDNITNVLADNLEAIERGEMTLEDVIGGHPEHRDELLELLPLALAIRGLPPITPRPGFRYTARSRILREITARQQLESSGRLKRVFQFSFPQFLLRPALSLAIVVVLLVATLSAGTVYAAGGSLPGDTLYSVKTAVADARLALSNDNADASLYLQFADERLHEINALVAKGRYDDLSVAAQRFEDQLQAASHVIDSATTQEVERLEDKAAQLDQEILYTHSVLQSLSENQNIPASAKVGIERALEASSNGQARLHTLFRDQFSPGPPGGVPPGQSEDVGPSADKPQGPQGVGPKKSPGPPDDKGKGSDKDKDKDKDRNKPAGPSKDNSQGPPPDVTQGPPEDKGKPEDSSNKDPSGNQPNNKP